MGTAAILAGGTLLPAQATAGSGYIDIVGNPTNPADNPGLLSIGLDASSPINASSVTAQIKFGSTSYIVPGPLTLTSGTATDGTWTVPTPIIEPTDLPLGQYYVYVSAADSGGDSISDVMVPDQWNFNIVPTVTLTANPDAILANGQTVALSGMVTAVTPDSSQPQPAPFAGQPVTITTAGEFFGGTYPWTVTSQNDGSFSFSTQTGMSASTGTDSFTAHVEQTPAIAQANSSAVAIQPIAAPVAVTATESPANPLWGQDVYITGAVTVDDDGSWQPLPNAVVEISDHGGDSVYVNANGSGQFSTDVLGNSLDLYRSPFTVQVNSNALSDPYAGSATISIPVRPQDFDAALTATSASIDRYGVVHFSGCVANTTYPAVGAPAGITVDVQYAASPSGPWKALGTLTTSGTSCGSTTGSSQFSGKLPAELASAYYRAVLGADQDYFVPIASNTLLASIIPTRFVTFTATPHKVRRDATITVSGMLQALGRSWHGYAGQWVDIIFQPPGSKLWYIVYRVRSGANGRFRKAFKDKFGSALWSADYFGNITHLVAGAAIIRIRVI